MYDIVCQERFAIDCEPAFPAPPRTQEEIDCERIQDADYRAMMPDKIAAWVMGNATRAELRVIDDAMTARDRYLDSRDRGAA